MDAFMSVPWDTIGPWGIIAFICGCILRGDLVSKATMNARMADRDILIVELKDRVTAVNRKFDVVVEHNSLLLRGAETTRHVVESLPAPAPAPRGGQRYAPSMEQEACGG